MSERALEVEKAAHRILGKSYPRDGEFFECTPEVALAAVRRAQRATALRGMRRLVKELRAERTVQASLI